MDEFGYDPDVAPDSEAWLALSDPRRHHAVAAYHLARGFSLGEENRDRMHADIHVIVENQIAMDAPGVRVTLERLMNGGVTRHNAVHAIGSVAAGLLKRLMEKQEPYEEAEYLGRLGALIAEQWL